MIIHLYTHFLPTFFLDFLLPSILPWIFVYYLMGTWTLFNLNCAVIWIKVHHHVRFVKKVYCLTDEIYTYKKNDHTNVYTKYFGWMEKEGEIYSLEVEYYTWATFGFLPSVYPSTVVIMLSLCIIFYIQIPFYFLRYIEQHISYMIF